MDSEHGDILVSTKESNAAHAVTFDSVVNNITKVLHQSARAMPRNLKMLLIHTLAARPRLSEASDDFSVRQALEATKGPFIEVGGPSEDEYWLGYSLYDTKFLNKKLHVSNVNPGVPIVNRKGEVVRYGRKVDFRADARQTPLRDESVGALFASNLPQEIRADVTEEGRRIVEPGGLFFIQGFLKKDIDYAKEQGFEVKESWVYKSQVNESRDRYNLVLQKATDK